jgi:hypothetical protein
MGGDPGDADAAGAVLDHDQDVEAAEEDGFARAELAAIGEGARSYSC